MENKQIYNNYDLYNGNKTRHTDAHGVVVLQLVLYFSVICIQQWT